MTRWLKDSSRCTYTSKLGIWIALFVLTFILPCLARAHDKADERVGQQAQNALATTQVPDHGPQVFKLRHMFHHGTHAYPDLFLRSDVPPDTPFQIVRENGHVETVPPLVAASQTVQIQRLKDRRPSTMEGMLAAARVPGYSIDVLPSAWSIDNVNGPNITDKATIIALATMTSDAYAQFKNMSKWSDVDGYNRSQPFGWESDGLRGHVFTNDDNSTVVIAIKGTSRGSFYDDEGTSTNDKLNDNLFASCCCAQQGSRWWTAIPGCDCATGTYTCNSTCLVQSMRNESRYYTASRHLYGNVTELYPNSNIWLAGHSLGGMISGLLGLTYGLPTVTFQAVPDALAASRLGLPNPPGSIPGLPQTRKMTGVYHVGHTGDPIYMGSCNGPNSLCSVAGFSFESQCHSGQSCIYDVVGDKGWRVSLWYHPIKYVIENVLNVYDTVPECIETSECQDCYNWKYYESHESSSTTTTSTSTSTSRVQTRTETCKTPGWWGCLDETTSTTTTTTSMTSTTSSTTSTCKTPGWFGCKDKTETTSSTSLAVAMPATQTPTPISTFSLTRDGRLRSQITAAPRFQPDLV